MTTSLTRADCKRDDVLVVCPNATLLGFGVGHCKRGFWVRFRAESGAEQVGRAIGRVTCEGKIYIEVATASGIFSSVFIRWADPAQVIEIRNAPPKSVFDFFTDPNWKPEAVFRALEYGVSDMHDQLGVLADRPRALAGSRDAHDQDLNKAFEDNAERQRAAHAAGRTKAGNDISGI